MLRNTVPEAPPQTVFTALTKVPADRCMGANKSGGETRPRQPIQNAARSLRRRPTVIHRIGKQNGCLRAVTWPVGGTIALICAASCITSITDTLIVADVSTGQEREISPSHPRNSGAP